MVSNICDSYHDLHDLLCIQPSLWFVTRRREGCVRKYITRAAIDMVDTIDMDPFLDTVDIVP